MRRDVMWRPWTGYGVEHLRLTSDGGGVLADGLVIGTEDGSPFRVRYAVRCDGLWRVRELAATSPVEGGAEVHLVSDGEGRWMSPDRRVSSLDGCVDVDVSATPFTNTLPIRRLGLAVGGSAVIEVAYVLVPEMRVEPARQRYTCLERDERGGLYRYESLDGDHAGFTAELPVDAEGLVLDYPGLFRRTSLA